LRLEGRRGAFFRANFEILEPPLIALGFNRALQDKGLEQNSLSYVMKRI
jgi:hypothetical protein